MLISLPYTCSSRTSAAFSSSGNTNLLAVNKPGPFFLPALSGETQLQSSKPLQPSNHQTIKPSNHKQPLVKACALSIQTHSDAPRRIQTHNLDAPSTVRDPQATKATDSRPARRFVRNKKLAATGRFVLAHHKLYAFKLVSVVANLPHNKKPQTSISNPTIPLPALPATCIQLVLAA